MDTKKDIGQFFNDNLNQMDFTPNEDGWDKIENELKEKKKKRRIFFWLFFGSFLSGCLVTLLLVYSSNLFNSNSESNKDQNNSETVVNSNANTNSNENSNSNSNNNSNKNSDANSLTNENNSSKEKTERNFSKDNNSINGETESNHLKNNNKNNVVSNDTKSKGNSGSNQSKQNRTNRKNNINNNNQINWKNTKRSNLNYSSNSKFSDIKLKNKSNSKQKSKSLTFKNKSKQKHNNSTNSTINSNTLENNNTIAFDKNLTTENLIAKDSNKVVASEIVVKDTTNIASIAKKPIKKTEKLLEKDSTEVVTKNKTNTFILSPYFGYGLLNKNQVTGNFKSTNNLNVSNEHYGFALRWMANEKLGIQIGLGYINATSKTEIEKTNSNNLTFNDVKNNSNVTFPPSNKLLMTHDLSMYEIPLEFYYKLNDKKIGLAFATGISHTIIKNNDVYIESPQEKTKIGSLETITNQSFSANLKVYGIYKFSNKLQFELYPSFQYQFLNAIKKQDLNPYILSFRAGISYQF
ncbi:MAG: hypothetical protein V4666_10490 [Bacteroidota bacterium]